MAKILLVGLCPLPDENTQKSYGPGLRTWQFLQAMLDAGHEVLTVVSRIPFIYEGVPRIQTVREEARCKIIQIDQDIFEEGRFLQQTHDEFKPDAIVGASVYPSSKAAQLATDAPVWIDFLGHVMAEAQAKVAAYNDRQYLQHFWQYCQHSLDRGSIFSTVCHRQEYAVIGELGVRGRLNEKTVGYHFTRTIPCAIEGLPLVEKRLSLKGTLVPEDAFVVLSSGGFNTWLDPVTMYRGVEYAMKQSGQIHFIATGGIIKGHDEKTFPTFQKLVEEGPFADRFHFVGWVAKAEVSSYFQEADLGINIDRDQLEGRLGSRNRLINWGEAALPSVTTTLCELAEELSALGLVFGVPLEDPAALGEAILKAESDRETLAQMGRRLQAHCQAKYSYSATCAPLVEWLKSPRVAEDLVDGKPVPLQGDVAYGYSVLARRAAQFEGELRKKNASLRRSAEYIAHLEKEYRYVTTLPWRFALSKTRQLLFPRKPRIDNALPALSPKPKVSVVVVSYNSAEFLPGCLDSLAGSDYPHVETIVVDNGSSDSSAELLQERYGHLNIIISERNRGFAGANNIAMRQSTGDLILMLNPDTKVFPDTVRRFVEGFLEQQEAGDPVAVAGCKILDPDAVTLQHAGAIIRDNGLTEHIGAREIDQGQFEEIADYDYVTGCAMCLRRELLERIGYLDEGFFPAYFEELDFCVRAREAGFRVSYFPRPRVLHYESQSTGLFTSRFFELYHRGRLRYIVLHYGLRGLLTRFLPAELRWLHTARPKAQLLPLLKAYLRMVWTFPSTWLERRSR